MIEVKNISKWFDGVQVLHGISAVFETGKTNLIIGQSGSGKTVLLKCLVGLLRPEEGEIYYDGRCLNTMNSVIFPQIPPSWLEHLLPNSFNIFTASFVKY